MKITLRKLKNRDACQKGLEWFDKNFGTEAEHTKVIKLLEKEKNTEYWIVWLIVNFKLTGRGRSWHYNGQLWVDCNYVNGKLHGRYRSWHYNGQLGNDCNYKNEKLHGRYKGWYRNGQLWVDCNYKNDKLIKYNLKEK